MQVDGVRLMRLLLRYQDLVDYLLDERAARAARDTIPLPDALEAYDLPAVLAHHERATLVAYLKETDGNVQETAELLNLHRSTLISRIRHYQLQSLTRTRGHAHRMRGVA